MSDLTQVELLWLESRIENRIRFGRVAEERILDRRRRVLSFAPGSIFAFVRWMSNDFGTVVSRIDILRAVAPGQRCSTVPYVKPGGESLLRLSGWPKVERVLQLIDAVEALGIDPADAAPDYWHPCAQPVVRQRNTSAIHPVPASGLAPSAEGDVMSARRATVFTTSVATVLLLWTIGESATTLHMECIEQRSNWPLPPSADDHVGRYRTCRNSAT